MSERNLDRLVDVAPPRGGVIRDIPIVTGDSPAIAGMAV